MKAGQLAYFDYTHINYKKSIKVFLSPNMGTGDLFVTKYKNSSDFEGMITQSSSRMPFSATGNVLYISSDDPKYCDDCHYVAVISSETDFEFLITFSVEDEFIVL